MCSNVLLQHCTGFCGTISSLALLSLFSSSLSLEDSVYIYRKNSKNWDTLNYHRDCPTNGIVAFYSAILRSKDSDRITNRVDTDQTAEEQSDLGLHCLLRPICPNISNYYGRRKCCLKEPLNQK